MLLDSSGRGLGLSVAGQGGRNRTEEVVHPWTLAETRQRLGGSCDLSLKLASGPYEAIGQHSSPRKPRHSFQIKFI